MRPTQQADRTNPPERQVVESVKYNPFMNAVLETWTVGGFGVGVDVGLRLLVR